MEAWLIALLIGTGVVSGFINTLAGGGSMLTLPVLMITGMPADVANGTNRLAVLAQSATGAVEFDRAGGLIEGLGLASSVLPSWEPP